MVRPASYPESSEPRIIPDEDFVTPELITQLGWLDESIHNDPERARVLLAEAVTHSGDNPASLMQIAISAKGSLLYDFDPDTRASLENDAEITALQVKVRNPRHRSEARELAQRARIMRLEHYIGRVVSWKAALEQVTIEHMDNGMSA